MGRRNRRPSDTMAPTKGGPDARSQPQATSPRALDEGCHDRDKSVGMVVDTPKGVPAYQDDEVIQLARDMQRNVPYTSPPNCCLTNWQSPDPNTSNSTSATDWERLLWHYEEIRRFHECSRHRNIQGNVSPATSAGVDSESCNNSEPSTKKYRLRAQNLAMKMKRRSTIEQNIFASLARVEQAYNAINRDLQVVLKGRISSIRPENPALVGNWSINTIPEFDSRWK